MTLTGCLPSLGVVGRGSGTGSATAGVDLLLFGVGLVFLPLLGDRSRLLAERVVGSVAGVVFVFVGVVGVVVVGVGGVVGVGAGTGAGAAAGAAAAAEAGAANKRFRFAKKQFSVTLGPWIA